MHVYLYSLKSISVKSRALHRFTSCILRLSLYVLSPGVGDKSIGLIWVADEKV